MKVVRDLVGRARAEPALALTEPLANVLNRLHPDITTGIFGSMLRGVDFVTSNVPGPPFPIYLAGARVVSQFPFGPMAGAAANITLLSYVDDLNIGINTDPAAVAGPRGPAGVHAGGLRRGPQDRLTPANLVGGIQLDQSLSLPTMSAASPIGVMLSMETPDSRNTARRSFT